MIPRAFVAAAFTAAVAGCGSSHDDSAAAQLQIVTVSGAPLEGVAGDAIALKVVIMAADGSVQDLPTGASVTWTGPAVVKTLGADDGTDASPLPVPGAEPTAAWIDNPFRTDRPKDLSGVLFLLDPGTVQNGTVQVSATVSGGSLPGDVEASFGVDPAPAGDWTRGTSLYAANCADCHGTTGQGSAGAPDATSYTIEGASYDFPAPGLNAAPGNCASDPAWNAAIFAVAARADMDNGGVTLRAPMPDWLSQPSPSTGSVLATQDLADIYAFLQTQTQ